jgi:hypothetical protein
MNTKERIGEAVDKAIQCRVETKDGEQILYPSHSLKMTIVQNVLGLFLSEEQVGCKYAVISHGIGIDGKVTEATIHCEFNPEIDYTVALSTTLKPREKDVINNSLCETCKIVRDCKVRFSTMGIISKCGIYEPVCTCDKLKPSWTEGLGCGICGGKQVLIRGRYPQTENRLVCPTCCQERLEQIRDISDRNYGVAGTDCKQALLGQGGENG